MLKWLGNVKRKAAAIVAATMLVAGPTVAFVGDSAPAGATQYVRTTSRPPAQNWCTFRYWFDAGQYNPSPAHGYQVFGYADQVPAGCIAGWQWKVRCGVYGITDTYYWHTGDYTSTWLVYPQATPPGPTFVNNDACPIWGNDIILSIELVTQIGGQYWCWSDNNLQWMALCLTGDGVHGYYEQNQITYWG